MRCSRHRRVALVQLVGLAVSLLPLSIQAATFHVSPLGSNIPPYSTYETAATDPRTAIDLAGGYGDTVLMHAGQYDVDTAMQVASGVDVIGVSRDSVELTFCCLTNIIPRHILNPLGDHVITGIRFQQAYLAVNQIVFGILTAIPEGHILIEDCSFYQLAISGTATDTMEIRNNYFEVGGGYGVVTQDGAGVVWVHDNLFRGGKTVSGPHCVSSSSTNTLVENNIFDLGETNFRGISVLADESNRGMIIRNNLMMGGDLAIAWNRRIGTIENNTIIRTDPTFGGTIEIINDVGYDVTVRNNVFVESPTPHASGCTGCLPPPQMRWLYNAYWPPAASFIDLGSGGSGVDLIDSANFNAYPMFTDASLYRLEAGSPLIDAGDPSILDVDGSGSDIGWTGGPWGISYEYEQRPPGAPESLLVSGTNGVVSLSWSSRPEADLAEYRLYRGETSGFWQPGIPPYRMYNASDTVATDTLLSAGDAHYYVVTAKDTAGLESNPSPEGSYSSVTGVDDDPESPLIPRTPYIARVYPNPFNTTATLDIVIPDIGAMPAPVRITLYDVAGRFAGVGYDGHLGAGQSSIQVRAATSDGATLASGVYFARLKVWNTEFGKTQKLVLLK